MVRKGCMTGKRYGTRHMGRTQEHSKLRVDVHLTVYLNLWLPLDENKGGPIFQKVLVTRFGGDETQTDPASEQHEPKSCNFSYFLNIFLLLRSAKEVTTENLNLKKWKTWPAEFPEDCEKCEKKLHEVKTQNLEANLEILKFSNPPKAWIYRTKKIF